MNSDLLAQCEKSPKLFIETFFPEEEFPSWLFRCVWELEKASKKGIKVIPFIGHHGRCA